jgi:hypothetical protein
MLSGVDNPWVRVWTGGRRRNIVFIAYQVIIITWSTRCSDPL